MLTKIRNTAALVLQKASNAFGGFKTPYIYFKNNGTPYFWNINLAGYGFNPHTFQDYLTNGYGQNPFVYMAADMISDTMCEMPFKFINRMKETVEPTPQINAFIDFLNQGQGYEYLIQMTSLNLSITGNFMYHKMNVAGASEQDPGFLSILHIPDVDIKTINGQEWSMPKAYDIKNYGPNGYIQLMPDEVIHCKYANPIKRTNWGLSPLRAGQVVYQASNNEFLSEAFLHENMGADGVLSRESNEHSIPMDVEDEQFLQDKLNRRVAGPENFGGIVATNSSLKWLPLRMDPTKLKTLELNNKNLRIVAGLYKLDPKIFGDPQAAAFNNYAEANVSAFNKCFVPHANFIFSCWTNTILKDMFGVEGVKMVVNTEQIPVLNQKNLNYEKELREQYNAGLITREEFRSTVHPEFGTYNPETNETGEE